MTGIGTASAYLLAAAFVAAAAAKLGGGARTAAQFHALGLPAARALAIAVPIVELGVAVALVAAPSAGGLAALVVLAAFSAVLARAVIGGTAAPCACFGRHRADPVSVVDLVRNLLLALLAVAALGAARPAVPSIGDVSMVVVATVAGTVLLAVLRRLGDARRPVGRPPRHR